MSTPVLTATVPANRRILVHNTAALMLAYVIPRGLTFVAGIAAARVLGASEFGLYTTAAALAVVVSVLASLGMQPLLVREIARDPAGAGALVGAAHLAKLATVTVMVAALAITPFLGFPPEVVAAAIFLGAGYTVGAFVDNLGAHFQGIEAMHVWAQASAVLGIVSGGVGIIAVLWTRNLLWFCVAPAFGQAAALTWLLRRSPRTVRWPVLPPLAAVTSLFRQLAPFAVAFIATTIFYRADVLILSRLRPAADVGVYGAANRFLDIVQALAIAGAGALLPHLSRHRSGSGAGTLTFLWRFAFAGVAVAVGLFAFREPIILGLYGAEYAGAIPLLAIVAAVALPRAVNMFSLAALAGADSIRLAGPAYLVAAAASIVLNLLIVPSYGALGTASVVLLTESALAIFLVRALLTRTA